MSHQENEGGDSICKYFGMTQGKGIGTEANRKQKINNTEYLVLELI